MRWQAGGNGKRWVASGGRETGRTTFSIVATLVVAACAAPRRLRPSGYQALPSAALVATAVVGAPVSASTSARDAASAPALAPAPALASAPAAAASAASAASRSCRTSATDGRSKATMLAAVTLKQPATTNVTCGDDQVERDAPIGGPSR